MPDEIDLDLEEVPHEEQVAALMALVPAGATERQRAILAALFDAWVFEFGAEGFMIRKFPVGR